LFLEAELRQTRYEWEPALATLQEAAEIAPHWWETRWRLGSLLRKSAHYAEALPHLQAAVALAEKEVDKANAMNSLALLYMQQGHWAEAEPLYRQAQAICEKIHGPEHPYVATDLNNLAQLLQDTNRLAEAEPLERRAVLILLKSTRAAGHELPNLRMFYGNYQTLLAAQPLKPASDNIPPRDVIASLRAAQKLNPQTIAQRLASLGPEVGYTPEEWAALQAGWAQVRVAGVVPGSQAEGLGLQPGDVITHYAGVKITSNARLVELTGLTKTPAIPLTILRAGQETTLTAQPGKLGVRLE